MSNFLFGRINRTNYVLMYLAMSIGGVMLGLALGLEADDFLLHRRELLSAQKSLTLETVLFAGQCFLAFATSLRLRDIGKSPLFAFIVLVPVLQWLVILYCLVKEGNVRATPSTQTYSRNNVAAVQANPMTHRIQPQSIQTSKVLFGGKGRPASRA